MGSRLEETVYVVAKYDYIAQGNQVRPSSGLVGSSQGDLIPELVLVGTMTQAFDASFRP